MTDLRNKGYNSWDYYHANGELKQVLDMIGAGYFSPDEPDRFQPIVEALLKYNDYYLLLADYASYVACHDRVGALYSKPDEWIEKAILNVAGMGKFSSDRTIRQYAEQIWRVKRVPVS